MVKKDKNYSSSIYQILNSNKTYDPKCEDKPYDNKGYLKKLLELIWLKIEEKYVALAPAFRFFDVQNVKNIICNKRYRKAT